MLMTQHDLGVAMGYTAANPVSKLERADLAMLDIGRLAAAARALDVDLEWLIEPAAKASRGRAPRQP
jgi:transcriptional regulator with XRE-family HTH domain